LPCAIPHPRPIPSTGCRPFLSRLSPIRRRGFFSRFPQKRRTRNALSMQGRFWWLRDLPSTSWCLLAAGLSPLLAGGVTSWAQGLPLRSGSSQCGWSWGAPPGRRHVRHHPPRMPPRQHTSPSRRRSLLPRPQPPPLLLWRFQPRRQLHHRYLRQARSRPTNPAGPFSMRIPCAFQAHRQGLPRHEPVAYPRTISSAITLARNAGLAFELNEWGFILIAEPCHPNRYRCNQLNLLAPCRWLERCFVRKWRLRLWKSSSLQSSR